MTSAEGSAWYLFMGGIALWLGAVAIILAERLPNRAGRLIAESCWSPGGRSRAARAYKCLSRTLQSLMTVPS